MVFVCGEICDVKLSDGRVCRRHIDHVRRGIAVEQEPHLKAELFQPVEASEWRPSPTELQRDARPSDDVSESKLVDSPSVGDVSKSKLADTPSVTSSVVPSEPNVRSSDVQPSSPLRRSVRVSRPPVRLDL